MKSRLFALPFAFVFAFLTSPAASAGEPLTDSKAPIIDDASPNPCAEKILGDRPWLGENGVTVNLETVYTYQNVLDGGVLRAGNVNGHIGSAELGIIVDTGKAGLWPGGFLTMRGEGRVSDGILLRAGATSPVNNQALLPNVPGRLGDDAFAFNELTYAQFFSEQVGIVLGLINTDTGDANPLAGYIGSTEYFLNTGFLYSNVTSAVVPTATLGGGLVIIPDANNQLKFLAIGTSETAGFDPFDLYDGTTFIAEWSTKGDLFGPPGGMTLAGYYGVDQGALTVTDPRILLQGAVPATALRIQDESWAISWNGYQFFSGDETGGWGIFGRLGLSDGDPNPIRWNGAVGFGGIGSFGRPCDRWGVGVYHVDYRDGGLFPVLGIDSETGGEIFYSIAVCAGVDVTLDLQVVDSALPGVDTGVIGGARVRMDW